MSTREQYAPGPASGAQVRKDGEKWTLILTRELRHSPEKVWEALTDPAHLREWAPFDADKSLGTVGTVAKLTTVGAPTPRVTETRVTRAERPKALEYNWGGFDMRWELEVVGGGTRLTLWTNIGHRFIAMGAAGWHICFDVLDRLLDGQPIGRIVGPEAMKFGWQRLNAEYAKQFGAEQRARRPAHRSVDAYKEEPMEPPSRTESLRFNGALERDPAIDAWMKHHAGELGAIARRWFEVMRNCGDEVREVLHDDCPTACLGDVPFGYVNIFASHVNVGFFHGAALPDPARLLQGTGKFMRHVKLKPRTATNVAALRELIYAAYSDIKARVENG